MRALLITTLLLLMSSSCSTMHIVKDCHAVQDLENVYVCKNLKPWE